MFNRILVVFGNEANKTALFKTAKELKARYSINVDGIYIKDIRKYEALPPSVEGLIVDNSSAILIREWEKAEDVFVKEAEEAFKTHFKDEGDEFIVDEGIIPDVIFDRMKGYDLVVVAKKEKVSADLKELLNHIFVTIVLFNS